MFKGVIMGVSGSGKTSLGLALQKKYAITFWDGDLLHLKANIDKMAGGTPLDDEDRAPWLARIADVFYAAEHLHTPMLIACSALKKAYRDYLRKMHPDLVFLYLKGDKKTILLHMQKRTGHFMQSALLDSQFAALEEPSSDEPNIYTLSIACDFDKTLESSGLILNNLLKSEE